MVVGVPLTLWIGLFAGAFGTIIGTGLGLSITYYVQENGIDYTKGIEALSNSSMASALLLHKLSR